MANNVNGSYNNELIHTRTCNDVVDVDIATFEWGTWWNESRLHQSLGYLYASRGGDQVLGTSPRPRNNGKQGTCLGTKPGALHICHIDN
ncbi:hypothetical protein [Corynebacterium falsenii]|uniref:hypothetical protein n=1 Tax=Corynebacterium falsenii TaxID=108486 RepID=UPI003FD38C56